MNETSEPFYGDDEIDPRLVLEHPDLNWQNPAPQLRRRRPRTRTFLTVEPRKPHSAFRGWCWVSGGMSGQSFPQRSSAPHAPANTPIPAAITGEHTNVINFAGGVVRDERSWIRAPPAAPTRAVQKP